MPLFVPALQTRRGNEHLKDKKNKLPTQNHGHEPLLHAHFQQQWRHVGYPRSQADLQAERQGVDEEELGPAAVEEHAGPGSLSHAAPAPLTDTGLRRSGCGTPRDAPRARSGASLPGLRDRCCLPFLAMVNEPSFPFSERKMQPQQSRVQAGIPLQASPSVHMLWPERRESSLDTVGSRAGERAKTRYHTDTSLRKEAVPIPTGLGAREDEQRTSGRAAGLKDTDCIGARFLSTGL